MTRQLVDIVAQNTESSHHLNNMRRYGYGILSRSDDLAQQIDARIFFSHQHKTAIKQGMQWYATSVKLVVPTRCLAH